MIWTGSGIFNLNVRLLFDPVQILVQSVQQKRQQFLGILLLVS